MHVTFRLFSLVIVSCLAGTTSLWSQDIFSHQRYIVVYQPQDTDSQEAVLGRRSARLSQGSTGKEKLLQKLESHRAKAKGSREAVVKSKRLSLRKVDSAASSDVIVQRSTRLSSGEQPSMEVFSLDPQGDMDLVRALDEDQEFLIEVDYPHKKSFSFFDHPSSSDPELVPVDESGDDPVEQGFIDRVIEIIQKILEGNEPPTEMRPEPIPAEQVLPVPQITPTPVSEVPETPVPEPILEPTSEELEVIVEPALRLPDDVEPLWTNDRHVRRQWAVAAIGLNKAWAIEQPGETIVVAVIDDGIDLEQLDLVNNIWTNLDEIAGNGIDDDGNGYIDDVHGWDFADNDNNPQSSDFHGTHVAGIVAAESDNGLGVAGFSLRNNIKILPLKVFGDGEDFASTFDIMEAVNYASNMGVRVINMSLGSLGYSWTYDQTIKNAVNRGAVVVAAAGNDTSAETSYPAAFPDAISVASVDQQGQRSSFSNFGVTVDVHAPGDQILSTVPGDLVEESSGTSMAAPMVSGLAALMFTQDPSLSRAQVVNQLLGTVDRVSTRQGIGRGQVNVFKAISVLNGDMELPSSSWDRPELTLVISKTNSRWYFVNASSSERVGVLRARMKAGSYQIDIKLARSGQVVSSQTHDSPVNGTHDLLDLRTALHHPGKHIVTVTAFRTGRSVQASVIVWYEVSSAIEDRFYEDRVVATGILHPKGVVSEVAADVSEGEEEAPVVVEISTETTLEPSEGYRRQSRQRTVSRSIIVR